MKVNVSGNISIGTALPQYIENKINEEVLKIFETAINANVSFTKNSKYTQVNIVINEGNKRGVLIKSSAESDDIYHAFDLALAKILKQLRKYKNKLRNYRKKVGDLKASNSDLPYILADRFILKQEEELEKESNEIKEEIKILEDKETEIEELTVDEALMKMDLINLPAFMFVNKENGLLNVIYRRPDGNLSWINPKK